MGTKYNRAALLKAIGAQDRSAVIKIAKALGIASDPWLASSCFQAAIVNSRIVSVQALVDAGAGLESMDAFGQRPVGWACRHGEARALEILLAAGADPDGKDSRGRAPLLFCLDSDKRLECAEILLARGADPLAKGDGGLEAYELACRGEMSANVKVRGLLGAAREAALLGREARSAPAKGPARGL